MNAFYFFFKKQSAKKGALTFGWGGEGGGEGLGVRGSAKKRA